MKRLNFRFRLDGRRSSRRVEGDPRTEQRHEEQGFMLVGLIVAIFIVLLVLGIAAPKMAQELKRDREVEAMHRGNQYVRAIQLYYRKSGTYPASMDALAKGTPVKFLRQQYLDPFTGKSDWRIIHVGEAKTTVKGLFGKPLTGLAPGLGSASGQASSGTIGAGAAGSGSAFGGSSGSAYGSSSSGSPSAFGSSGQGTGGLGSGSSSSGPGYSNTSGAGASSAGTPSAGTPTAGGATTGTDSSGTGSTPTGSNSTLGSAAGIASESGSSFAGGGAPFVGVGIPKEGTSIVVLNEQKTYNSWEFIYDPRIEQLKQAAGLLGGGNQGLGSAGGLNSGVGGTGTGASGYGAPGNSGFGASSGSGFGSSSGSSFGSSSGSSFGSSPSSGNGSSPSSGTQGSGTTTPTTPQQPQ